MRKDQRKADELRPVKIEIDVSGHAEGSALIEFGKTRVLCTASVETSIPKWMQENGNKNGWITAEYGMLPRSTNTRIRRDKALTGGRTQEISRLIGRSLRAAVDLKALGEKQIIVDCDVIHADGGTRTAAITGGFVALALALKKLKNQGSLQQIPIKHFVAAISTGLLDDKVILDLCYDEDCKADTDMNFVFVSSGDFVEVQGTGEGKAFSQQQLDQMIELGRRGCLELFGHQKKVLGDFLPGIN